MAATTTPRTPRRRAHALPAPPAARQHRRQVAAWALHHGHRLDRDALAVLVGLRYSHARGDVDRCWTARDVTAVLSSAAALWCSSHGVAPPSMLCTTLLTYLRFLAAHHQLDAGSDPPRELRRAAEELRTAGAARARHPAGSRRGVAPVLPLR